MTDPETLDKYKTDEETAPHYHHLPEVVVMPANTEEVAAVMKIPTSLTYRLPRAALVPAYPAVQCPFAAALCF